MGLNLLRPRNSDTVLCSRPVLRGKKPYDKELVSADLRNYFGVLCSFDGASADPARSSICHIGVRRNNRNIKTLCSTVERDRKSTRLNSSHGYISYAVFCLKKK